MQTLSSCRDCDVREQASNGHQGNNLHNKLDKCVCSILRLFSACAVEAHGGVLSCPFCGPASLNLPNSRLENIINPGPPGLAVRYVTHWTSQLASSSELESESLKFDDRSQRRNAAALYLRQCCSSTVALSFTIDSIDSSSKCPQESAPWPLAVPWSTWAAPHVERSAGQLVSALRQVSPYVWRPIQKITTSQQKSKSWMHKNLTGKPGWWYNFRPFQRGYHSLLHRWSHCRACFRQCYLASTRDA